MCNTSQDSDSVFNQGYYGFFEGKGLGSIERNADEYRTLFTEWLMQLKDSTEVKAYRVD